MALFGIIRKTIAGIVDLRVRAAFQYRAKPVLTGELRFTKRTQKMRRGLRYFTFALYDGRLQFN